MDDAQAQAVAALLRHHRQATGLSQEELAARAGVSVRSISNLERGVPHRPRKDTLALLAGALGLSAADREHLLAMVRGAVAQTSAPALPADARAPQPWPATLPIPPTPLIGRNDEVATATAFLRAGDLRLLTLSGPAGVGKTRLGIEVARHLSDTFADGVVFVDLSPLRDSLLVGAAIAVRLDISLDRGESQLMALASALRDKHMLLVLDNFEHILPAASLMADLLARCQRIRLLATSRVPLHIRSEQVCSVAPLPLATPSPDAQLEELARVPSIALFVQRASAHQPGFQLTQDNARAVTEICAHLDGLPLAIELAAARIAFESPVALLSHLGTRLRVLVDGARDLPARQQTMRGTLDWSYQLLAPNERAVFRRLALFAGGCDREAADSVCRLRDDEELDVESALPSLVSKNLIRHDGRGDSSTGRVTMLETIREYARDRLQQQGETDATARLHFAYYAALAETASQHLTGTTQGAWLKRLDGEHDNLRVALQWAEESGESEAGLQLAGALWRYWFRRGHLSEGLGWLERFLAHNAMAGHNAVSTARARALSGAGILAHRQGDYSRALALLEQSLADWRALGDDVRSASALNNMALVARAQGSADRAMSLWREALALLPTGADARLTALMLNNLATLHQERADFAHALALYEQSISIRRELGDVFGIANVLGNLGELAREQGDYVRAVALMREALALQRELGDRLSIALSLNNLGIAACDQGSLDEAESLLTESLSLFRQAEDRRNAALTLANLGNVERLRHHDDRARNLIEESLSICQSLGDIQSLGYARLYQGLVAYDQGRSAEAERMLRDALTSLRATGSKTLIARCLEALSRITYGTHPASALRVLAAMGALRATIGAPQSPVEHGVCSRLLEDVRAALGDERFQTIWAEGAAFSLDDAVAEASVAAPGAPSLTDTSAARHHPFILAPRAARGPAAPPPPPSR